MKLKPLLIESFARYALGSELFDNAIRITSTLKDKDIPGEQKKQEAFEALRQTALALGAFAINFAIELAVAWLKSKGRIK
jgi:hypothetical protein